MSAQFTIRDFAAADLERMRTITVDAFDGVSIDQNIENRFGKISNKDWKWRKAKVIDHDVAQKHSFALVAADGDDRVIGLITCRFEPDSGVGFIPNLAVDGRHRGKGIGRRLIEAAVERFRSHGCSVCRIETLDQNPIGQHLYPDCGFVEVARQIHYARPIDPDAD